MKEVTMENARINTSARHLHMTEKILIDENQNGYQGHHMLPEPFDILHFVDGILTNSFTDDGDVMPAVQCEDGHFEYWVHGRLHGNPAIVDVETQTEEQWDHGVFVERRPVEGLESAE
jgi:hypothetical protein